MKAFCNILIFAGIYLAIGGLYYLPSAPIDVQFIGAVMPISAFCLAWFFWPRNKKLEDEFKA